MVSWCEENLAYGVLNNCEDLRANASVGAQSPGAPEMLFPPDHMPSDNALLQSRFWRSRYR